jgi:hypothetical protein
LDYSGTKTYGTVRNELRIQQTKLRQNSNSVEKALSFNDYVGAVASRMTAPTRFHGRITINDIPRVGYLNIIFLAADPDGIFKGFKGNTCAYIGTLDTILCNAVTLRKIFDGFDEIHENYTTSIMTMDDDGTLNFSATDHLDTVRQSLKQNFLIWLLGHEIGHAVLHSKLVAARSQSFHVDVAYDKREQEADQFVVRAIRSDPVLQATFPIILLEFIEQEFHRLYRDQFGIDQRIIPAKRLPGNVIIVQTKTFSVPLLIRAIRIMDATLIDNPKALYQASYGILDDHLSYIGSIKFPEYYFFLRSRVVISEESTEIDSKIAMASLAFASLIAFSILLYIFFYKINLSNGVRK